MLPRTVLLLIFYLEYQKDVHGKKSVATSEQVCPTGSFQSRKQRFGQ